MKKLLASIIALGLSTYGCGQETQQIDPRLRTTYNNFMHDAKANRAHLNTEDLIMTVVDDMGEGYEDVVGTCSMSSGNRRHVKILKSILSNAKGLKSVTYHELGHCLLGLGHDDKRVDIMNTFVTDVETNWEANVAVLFYKFKFSR